jgi:lysozyme
MTISEHDRLFLSILGVLLLLLASITLAFVVNHQTKAAHQKSAISSKQRGEYCFGIDVSHYQGRINWKKVERSHHPINYIFMRSTMGGDGKDKEFRRNWRETKRRGYLRGAYHYYRPNEKSTYQFENFSSNVRLEEGDLPPVLDIEELGRHGSDNLRKGVLNWLSLAEEHYGVKPIIYTGRTFYNTHLKGHVDQYPLWIASYTSKNRLKHVDWDFHQFTEKVRVTGIKTSVDGNDFRGTIGDLKKYCITKL